MIINDSSIQLFSERNSIEQHKQTESLNIWKGDRPATKRGDFKEDHHLNSHGGHRADHVEFSRKAIKAQPQRAVASPVDEELKPYADLNITILREMIQRLTGKVMDIRLPQDVASGEASTLQESENSVAEVQQGVGFGLEYDYYESHYEYESTSFSAQGVITTADGREVNFNVQLNMTREFMQEQSVSIRAGDALKDPLAVNFSGAAAELTHTSFSFDIDMDGKDDQIAFAGPDSGFLALDKNEDGLINDGSELFGPATGDGFAELAKYDDDGNRWIDANDAIFEHLRIWMKNSEGDNTLFSLGEKGIGAIYLNHIDTPFSIKDADNGLLGQVRETGLFVKENGTVGTIQQIDLAV